MRVSRVDNERGKTSTNGSAILEVIFSPAFSPSSASSSSMGALSTCSKVSGFGREARSR